MIIEYEDFAKVEMKIGTIKSAEVVADADRLLRLTVDVGEENDRQIISGIRKFVDEPEDLIGQQFPFVLNIKSKTIRGLQSQGMILAAGNEESFAFLKPTVIVPAGTKLT